MVHVVYVHHLIQLGVTVYAYVVLLKMNLLCNSTLNTYLDQPVEVSGATKIVGETYIIYTYILNVYTFHGHT